MTAAEGYRAEGYRAEGYRYIDADTHLYEPRDAFTRHLEPRYAELGVRVITNDAGTDEIWVGDRRFTFLEPLYDSAPVPGSLRDVLRNLKSGQITESRLTGPLEPAFVDRDARLRWMDEHGEQAAIVVPSLGGTVERFMEGDPLQTDANLRAYNRWVHEDWGFAYQNRIFATPMISLLDPALAVTEVDWLLGHGARVIHLRPGPAGRRSPADPIFDPFWARVEEAGALVVLHISESGYNELVSSRWSELANPSSWNISAFQWTCTYGDRPIIDTIAAMILHNLFGRFPGLQILSLENGSLWVPYVLAAMDKMKGMGRNSPWIGGKVHGRPSDIFRQHVSVAPFHEENMVPLVELIGADRVVFGSDYPHPEGVAAPEDFLPALRHLPEETVRRIMRDNTLTLLGL